MNPDTLIHFGVKGMRWGKTKTPDRVSVASPLDRADGDKSKHRVRLEAKYLSRGRDQKTAVMQAEKRIKIEKILAVTGGVAVTAAAAYVIRNEAIKRFSSVTLERGAILKNINAFGGDKVDLNRRLYTTFENGDTQKYRGLLAETLRKNASLVENGSRVVYETHLTAKERIRAPSHQAATKMYNEFRKGVPGLSGVDYKSFNREQLLLPEQYSNAKGFMDALRNKGFNAVLDSNDQFISGFNTRKPLILFNAQSSVFKSGEKIVSEQLSKKLAKRQTVGLIVRAASPSIGLGVAAVALNKSGKTANKYEAINEYLKNNPNSDNSYAEIYAAVKPTANGGWTVKM